tara:strand:+ start:83 stop:310 length:228 start_codon:yes stop_codon:yes gene_type:complete
MYNFQIPRSKGEFHSIIIDSPLSDERLAEGCWVDKDEVRTWRDGSKTPHPTTWGYYAKCVFHSEVMEGRLIREPK